jgi:hypothetical protein
MATLQEMQEYLRTHKDELMKKHNATDVTIGLKESGGILTNELAYQFWVKDKKVCQALSADEMIPAKIEEAKTDVWVERNWKSLELASDDASPNSIPATQRYRPLQPGCGIGNVKITQGTPGALYEIPGIAKRYALSNGHVLSADPFNYIKNQASVNVLQPGPYGGGTFPVDHVGDLRYMMLLNDQTDGAVPPVYSIGCLDEERSYEVDGKKYALNVYNDGTIAAQGAAPNTADCALAELLDNVEMLPDQLENPNCPRKPSTILQPGMKVKLTSWRMDGTTHGIVTSVGKSASVNYSPNPETGKPRQAMFVDLIVTTLIGQPGTSGAGVITDDEEQAFGGLNFAGDGQMNLICSIQHIDAAFGGHVVCSEKPVDPIEPPVPDEIWAVKGIVTDEDMIPLETVEVVTIAGNTAKTDINGAFLLEYQIPIEAATRPIVEWIEFSKPGYKTIQQITSVKGETIMTPIVMEKIKKKRVFNGILNFFGIQMPITGVLSE